MACDRLVPTALLRFHRLLRNTERPRVFKCWFEHVFVTVCEQRRQGGHRPQGKEGRAPPTLRAYRMTSRSVYVKAYGCSSAGDLRLAGRFVVIATGEAEALLIAPPTKDLLRHSLVRNNPLCAEIGDAYSRIRSFSLLPGTRKLQSNC